MKNYHITVAGIPNCEAPVYQLMKERKISVKRQCDAACSCGYGPKKAEAEADAAKLREVLKDVEVQVVEGKCHEDPWWQTDEGKERARSNQDYEDQKYA